MKRSEEEKETCEWDQDEWDEKMIQDIRDQGESDFVRR